MRQQSPHHIGIVIPAHNEADTILACLKAIQIAKDKLNQSPLNSEVTVDVLVVLDSCTDNTLALVKQISIDYRCCEFRCVGKVRDLGVRELIKHGATWIACTDADTQVDENWLIEQLNHQPTSMICGVVCIDSWDKLSAATKLQYLEHYHDEMGHQHIHGANLSFSSEAYLATGGFSDMKCHEDVDLVKRFQSHDLAITWSNKVRVTTSSRLDARADEGFAYFLRNLEAKNSK